MGKKKYIESPERFWELFEMYKTYVKSNPRYKIEYVGRDGERVETPIEQPLTMEGFECFCMNETKITYPDLTDYFEGKIESYKDYLPISIRIRREIRLDQVSGGMSGFYNANLTARINGLKEQNENHNLNQNINLLNIDPLDDSADNGTS